MIRVGILVALALAIVALGAGPRAAAPGHETAGRTEVVVSLTSPPLATGGGASRVEAEQRAFRAALSERLPDARVRWRYRLVANGFAVVLPRSEIVRLRELPGVREGYEAAQYGPQLDGSPAPVRAPVTSSGELMRMRGLDPPRPFGHTDLNRARLPIPPHPRGRTILASGRLSPR